VCIRLLIAAALLSAGSAWASELPPPLGLPDLTGPRTLALSAGIGNASGTEALFLNPAAIAARRRFVGDATFLLDRRPGSPTEDTGMYFGGSVVDSVSAPIAAGTAYVRAQKGVYEGNLWHLTLAGRISERMFLGVTGKYYKVSGPEEVSSITMDAGLFWQLTENLSVGGAGYNLIPTNNDATLPRGVGAGFTFGSERSLQVVGDWRADFDRDPEDETKNRYGIGAEYFLGGRFPVRAGYQFDEILDSQFWSVGAGLVSGRMAIDFGFRQSIDDASARTFAVAIRGFFPTE
jgi:hypothetical protein